jgi:hypothetical protein
LSSAVGFAAPSAAQGRVPSRAARKPCTCGYRELACLAEIRQYRALARTGTDPIMEPFTDRVDAQVSASAATRRLAAVLARLPASHRDALLLVAWGDLSYEEAATSQESWQTADDLHEAWYAGGRLLVVPYTPPDVISYAELNALPPDPMALIEYVYRIEAREKGEKPGGSAPTADPAFAFTEISNLLGAYILPPRLTAEAFQALADIPGVTVDQDAVTLAGIHGVAFVYRPYDLELILNSRSDYAVIGFKAGGPGQPTKDWATLTQALVSGPGVRP